MDNGSNADACLSEAKRLEREGELFRAYDAAMKGLAQDPGNVTLAHLAVLCLGRAGATELALAKFAELGLSRHIEDLEVRSLSGRLLKDQGLRENGELRSRLLRQAYQTYFAAYEQAKASRTSGAYYPGINAATLALLIGGRTEA